LFEEVAEIVEGGRVAARQRAPQPEFCFIDLVEPAQQHTEIAHRVGRPRVGRPPQARLRLPLGIEPLPVDHADVAQHRGVACLGGGPVQPLPRGLRFTGGELPQHHPDHRGRQIIGAGRRRR